MTQEELSQAVIKKFPQAAAAAVQVKNYLTLKVPTADALAPMAAWLRDSLGFVYLDMITAVDYLGPVEAKGFVMDPNPNVFLPEGATPQVETPSRTPGFPYRDSIEVVYCLSSFEKRLKLFLKVEVPRNDARVPSLIELFKAADWQEREAFDLLGVVFEGHPNLTKILTPDFIQGHPLRKDYHHTPDRFD